MQTGATKTKIILVLLILFLGVSTGCRQAETPAQGETEVPASDVPSESADRDEESSEMIETGDIHQAEGRYVGFADTRSIEIEIIDGDYDYMVFQLSESVQHQLEIQEPEPGTNVIIRFEILEQGQPLITELEVK